MPKLIWQKWFPQDWKSDPKLSRCSAATRGVWMDAICVMMMNDTDRISGTDAELARDCRCSEAQIKTCHDELSRYATAEVTMQNGCKTWICRRLSRELSISKLRANAANVRWSKGDANTLQELDANHNANTYAPSVSASASVSSVPEGGVVRGKFEPPDLESVRLQFAKIGVPITEAEKFIGYYESNGWRVGKNPMKSWTGATINWRARWQERHQSTTTNGTPRKPFASEIKTAMASIQQQIDQHPANRNSAYFKPGHTPEQRGDLAGLRQKLSELQLQHAESVIPV